MKGVRCASIYTVLQRGVDHWPTEKVHDHDAPWWSASAMRFISDLKVERGARRIKAVRSSRYCMGIYILSAGRHWSKSELKPGLGAVRVHARDVYTFFVLSVMKFERLYLLT